MGFRCFGLALSAALLGASAAHADLRISSAATSNVTCSNGVCSATAANAVLNATDLANMLATGDVTVQSGSAAQDIEIDAALSWATTSRLTLDAYHSIAFSRPLTVAGGGGLTITTSDGGSDGDFRFLKNGRVDIQDTLHSGLTINGAQYALVRSIRELGKAVKNTQWPVALVRDVIARHPYSTSPMIRLPHGFEGLGHTVSDLTIEDSTDRCVAFFGCNETASFRKAVSGSVNVAVRDIGLVNVNITANGFEQNVGSLIAMYNGTDVSIINVYATGRIAASNTGHSFVGGLAGKMAGSITNASAQIDITASGQGEIVGGLVGQVVGQCEPCSGLIDRSYATGAVSGGDTTIVGGLVGNNLGATVSNSYATGAVSGGQQSSVGGLVGENDDSPPTQSSAVLQSSYSTGSVSGGSGSTLGGLIGRDLRTTGTIADAYWDLDTSGISNRHRGAGNVVDDPGITGLTDAQLKAGLPAGFDKHIWKQNPKINNGYPYLIDNLPN